MTSKICGIKIIAFMPWKQRRRHILSNATWQRNENVLKKAFLSERIRMVITRFVIEWFAGINCIILRSQIPVLTAPLTRRGKTKFATIKWYNLCRQIIQSQTCYPLIINFNAVALIHLWRFIQLTGSVQSIDYLGPGDKRQLKNVDKVYAVLFS